MFNVHYNIAGDIVSYQESPDGETSEHNAAPQDCMTLSFAAPVPGMFKENGQTLMKVDVDTGKLVLKNPHTIPDPLPNPRNAAA